MTGFAANVLASPGQVIDRAVRLSIAHTDDRVSVAGPYGLAAMIALCRRGFERVECAHHATCAGADDTSDLLLILGPMAADELTATVRRMVPLLRDGGALMVQLSRPGDGAAVRNVLAGLRYDVTGMIIDRSCGRLVTFTLNRPTPLQRTG
jgi:hypothetical protein